MGDIALRGNKLTRGPHGHGPKPFLNKPGQAQGTHGGKAKGGRIGFKKGTKKGGIGDLMGELYRLFEIGPLLGSPELMDIIQNLPFEKGGRAGLENGGDVQLASAPEGELFMNEEFLEDVKKGFRVT